MCLIIFDVKFFLFVGVNYLIKGLIVLDILDMIKNEI